MLQIFKKLSSAWTDIKVIVSDKDCAGRNNYIGAFPHVQLELCRKHVTRAWDSEVTHKKRNIPNDMINNVKHLLYSMLDAHRGGLAIRPSGHFAHEAARKCRF
ncbi:unnamed protein product [Gordionus sp. m RMFG-2023]